MFQSPALLLVRKNYDIFFFFIRRKISFPRRELRQQCPRGSTWRSFHLYMCLTNQNWGIKIRIFDRLFWNLENLYCPSSAQRSAQRTTQLTAKRVRNGLSNELSNELLNGLRNELRNGLRNQLRVTNCVTDCATDCATDCVTDCAADCATDCATNEMKKSFDLSYFQLC